VFSAAGVLQLSLSETSVLHSLNSSCLPRKTLLPFLFPPMHKASEHFHPFKDVDFGVETCSRKSCDKLRPYGEQRVFRGLQGRTERNSHMEKKKHLKNYDREKVNQTF